MDLKKGADRLRGWPWSCLPSLATEGKTSARLAAFSCGTASSIPSHNGKETSYPSRQRPARHSCKLGTGKRDLAYLDCEDLRPVAALYL